MSPDRSFAKTCRDKCCYRSVGQARAGIKRHLGRHAELGGTGYRAYRCPFCRFFHFGRKNNQTGPGDYKRPKPFLHGGSSGDR